MSDMRRKFRMLTLAEAQAAKLAEAGRLLEHSDFSARRGVEIEAPRKWPEDFRGFGTNVRPRKQR